MELARARPQQVMSISHSGHEFNNTSEIQDYVASHPEEEKYDVIVSIRDQLMQVHQQLERALISYMDYVEALPVFQGRDQRDLSWESIRATVQDAKDKLQRVETAKTTVDRVRGNQLLQLYDTTTWSCNMRKHVQTRRGVSSRTTVHQPMDFKMITDHGNPGSHQLSEQELIDDGLSRASISMESI